MNTPTQTEETQIIPKAVTAAIGEVRSAVVRRNDSDQRLLESIVQLYLVCKETDVRLTVRELARQTDCSISYLSQAWRATEKCLAKKKSPLPESAKLGFNEYVRKYVTVKRRAAAPRPQRVEVTAWVAQFEAMQADLRAQAPTLPVAQQERLIDELLDLATYLRAQLPKPTERPLGTSRHTNH